MARRNTSLAEWGEKGHRGPLHGAEPFLSVHRRIESQTRNVGYERWFV